MSRSEPSGGFDFEVGRFLMRFQVALRCSDSVAMEKNMIEGFLEVLWRFFSGFSVVFFFLRIFV